MNKLFALFIFTLSFNNAKSQQDNLKLWYRHPANALTKDLPDAFKEDSEWLKALPLGNGNIGAMVFGDVNNERVQLNEKTLWSGSLYDNDNPEAKKNLQEIRTLLFEGKYKEATELSMKTQICRGVGSGHGMGAKVPFGCFQTLGDLRLDFGGNAYYSDYYRELDLHTAIATVSYLKDGIHFKREYFISAPANVLAIRFTADKKKSISFSATLDRPERFGTIAQNDELTMSGTMDNGQSGEGMKYMARLKAKLIGGTQKVSDQHIIIKNADEVILYLTALTNYLPNYPIFKGRDYKKITSTNLQRAYTSSYFQLKKTHIEDYQHYFNRVSFSLGAKEDSPALATDELLNRIKSIGNDNYLTQLYFQYGRYLLIASSRENSLPANLQGIWANKIQTPWNGDYHTDINVEMNYWLSETCNLSELSRPLISFIKGLEKPGAKTASTQFGARGWCIGPITNVWGFTSPGEHPSWGLTLGLAGWLCQHLWEHYAFTKDTNYLRSVYPNLKGAATFYYDWLVKDPTNGKYVSGPSASSENSFYAPDGSIAALSMGPSLDQEIIEELFGNVIKAATLLQDKDAMIDSIKIRKQELLQPGIAEDGRLMEWAKPFKEVEPGHRHLSHLYAVYPGDEFDKKDNSKYFEAARKSLAYRFANGSGQTGWSAAWMVNLWARFKDGDEALKLLHKIYTNSTATNLFDFHPPFQIDGNFGATTGIAEMLLQSDLESIALLPALPTQWQNGQIKGLCARGGFVVNMKWEKGKLKNASIFSKKGGLAKIVYGNKKISLQTKAGVNYPLNKFLVN
ncbi:MAG: glycoside hydrolase family 95 protein [Bacteroidetes bacterium]|nr:glycoside hydrolase family 95 protein [Bacteroidota bacterium]